MAGPKAKAKDSPSDAEAPSGKLGKRILVCTMGTSPGVVTCAVWALLHQKPEPWVPTDIVIVTTARGAGFKDAVDGALQALWSTKRGDLLGNVDCPKPDWRTIRADDLGSDEHLIEFAEYLDKVFQRRNQEDEVHLCAAGGRNGMLMMAPQLMNGRALAQDRLTQVLLEPPGVEESAQISDFFYPGHNSLTVRFRDDKGTYHLCPSGQVTPKLAEVPFVSKEALATLGPANAFDTVLRGHRAARRVDEWRLCKRSDASFFLGPNEPVARPADANLPGHDPAHGILLVGQRLAKAEGVVESARSKPVSDVFAYANQHAQSDPKTQRQDKACTVELPPKMLRVLKVIWKYRSLPESQGATITPSILLDKHGQVQSAEEEEKQEYQERQEDQIEGQQSKPRSHAQRLADAKRELKKELNRHGLSTLGSKLVDVLFNGPPGRRRVEGDTLILGSLR